jgi:two-component system sensor kinase FixL
MQAAAEVPSGSDARFESLIATAVDGVVVIDERGTILVFNPACERHFGYPAGEAVGRNVKMLMPSPYCEAHDSFIADYRCTGTKKIIGIGREVLALRKDGSIFPMYLSVGEGKHDGSTFFVGIIHDLTAEKDALYRQQEASRLLANIIESSEDVILSKSLDGIVMSWNPAAERIFGYGADEMIGRSIAAIIPPDRREEEQDILRRIRAGERIEQYETVRRRKDGTEIVVSLTVSPLRDAEGNIVGASKIARDVTERRRAEQNLATLRTELFHVSRLSAMGQTTAAIAHELNQPLTAVTNYLYAAKRLLACGGDGENAARVGELIEKAVAQLLRAGGIIRNLRDFLQKRECSRAACDLNEIVEESVALGLAGGADVNIKSRILLDPSTGPVLVDKVQIQQVILNLIRNGIEAMAESQTRELTLSTGPDGPGFAQVTVADSGPGLTQDVIQRLFQPFLTTKGSGMGIGLNICKSIVEDHGGRIWLLADTGRGAAFRVRLPLADCAGGT